MAAPSATIWGGIVGGYGRIGLHSTVTRTVTTLTITTDIWFWSKYSVSDTSNTLYYGASTSSTAEAVTSAGSKTISTTVASGSGWSTSNQQKLHTFTTTVTKTTSNYVEYVNAKLTGVDRVGGTMTVREAIAIPALPSYTISYNANGGTGAPSSQTKYGDVAVTLSSIKPTRTGYVFKGWGTSATDTSVDYDPGDSYSTNASVTLYAIWTAVTYTIRYNANGGTGAPSAQTKTYGVALTLSNTVPTRTNYTFKGWSSSASAKAATWQPGGSFTNNGSATLYAVWEYGYVKPRVTKTQISRCTSSGSADDGGTYASISFDWACDKTVSSITITLKRGTTTSGTYTITASGTSGKVSTIVGNGTLSTENTYSVTIVVADSVDSTHVFGTLAGTKFPIDIKSGGSGVAIGKPAEYFNLFDIGIPTRHFGGLSPVVLEAETDLNTVLTPNTYTGADISSNRYLNCPVTSGTFTLVVESCGANGQYRQTYYSCSKMIPQRFTRFYYGSSWGDWLWSGADEYVLYDSNGGAGSSTEVTFPQSLAYYRYIEIYYTDNNGKSGGYTKVWNPNGKTVCLSITEASSATNVYMRQTVYELSSIKMTPNLTTAGYLSFSLTNKNVSGSSVGTNYINIVRVIGRA